MEHRDSPEAEPEPTGELREEMGRRFTRLVAPHGPRRVALPRLIVAGGSVFALSTLMLMGGSWLVRSIASWVAERPEHQIRFSEIELEPAPDLWIKDGKSLILAQVRESAKLGETINLLDLDLKALKDDFRRCPWVKDVLGIDRTHHGRLIVRLAYRKPAAIIEPERPSRPFVLDDEAVVLDSVEIDWAKGRESYQPRGIGSPLLKLRQIPPSAPRPRVGLPWKRLEKDLEVADEMVRRGAKLARFVQDRLPIARPSRARLDLASIYLPVVPEDPYFLVDSDNNLICWGTTPGDEKPDDTPPEARWRGFLDWLEVHGQLVAHHPNYLDCRGAQAMLFEKSKGLRPH